ncbi:TPA: helix-turn-helix domain-containing protein [Raoultella planticola]
MATIINTTRQTINKRLVAWEKLGWIEAKYGKILIVNMSALRQLYIDEDE